MRFDLFIIWGNGLRYIPEIISEIRDNTNFKIVRLKYHSFDDTDEFIKNIYKCDTVPMEHLTSKTRYLFKHPKIIMSVLVKNNNPEELEVGSGNLKHLQCQKINEIKKIIRSKFNPLFVDTEKQISPLPKGVSHEHCIHSTDYELQTDYLLGFLKMQSISFYKRFDNLNIEIPWHLSFSNARIKRININYLRCNIIDEGIKSIEDTTHFKYVKGNKKNYVDYVNKNIGLRLQEDHYPLSFDKLIDNFDKNYGDLVSKRTYIIINSNNVILDGVHRAAILKSIGEEVITCLEIW